MPVHLQQNGGSKRMRSSSGAWADDEPDAEEIDEEIDDEEDKLRDSLAATIKAKQEAVRALSPSPSSRAT